MYPVCYTRSTQEREIGRTQGMNAYRRAKMAINPHTGRIASVAIGGNIGPSKVLDVKESPQPPTMVPCWSCKGFIFDDNGAKCKECHGVGMVPYNPNPMGMNPEAGR